VNLHC